MKDKFKSRKLHSQIRETKIQIKILESNIDRQAKDIKFLQEKIDINSAIYNPRRWQKAQIMLMTGGFLNNGTYEVFPMIPRIVIVNNECWAERETHLRNIQNPKCRYYHLPPLRNLFFGYSAKSFGNTQDIGKSINFFVMTIQGMIHMLRRIAEYCGTTWENYEKCYIKKGLSQIKWMDNKKDLKCNEPNWFETVTMTQRYMVYYCDPRHGSICHFRGFRNPDWLVNNTNAVSYVSPFDDDTTMFKQYGAKWVDNKYNPYEIIQAYAWGNFVDNFWGTPVNFIDKVTTLREMSYMFLFRLEGCIDTDLKCADGARRHLYASSGDILFKFQERILIGHKDAVELSRSGSWITGKDISNGMEKKGLYITEADSKSKPIDKLWHDYFIDPKGKFYSRHWAENSFQNIVDAIKWNLKNGMSEAEEKIYNFQVNDKAVLESEVILTEEKLSLLNEALDGLKKQLLEESFNEEQNKGEDFSDDTEKEKPKVLESIDASSLDLDKPIPDNKKKKKQKKPKNNKEKTPSVTGYTPLPLAGGDPTTTIDSKTNYLQDPVIYGENKYPEVYRRLMAANPVAKSDLEKTQQRHKSIVAKLKKLKVVSLAFLNDEEIIMLGQVPIQLQEDIKKREEEDAAEAERIAEAEAKAKAEEENKNQPSSTTAQVKAKIRKYVADYTWQEMADKQYQYSLDSEERPFETSDWKIIYAPRQRYTRLVFSNEILPEVRKTLDEIPTDKLEEYIQNNILKEASHDHASVYFNDYKKTTFDIIKASFYKDVMIFQTKETHLLFLKGGRPMFSSQLENSYGRKHVLIDELIATKQYAHQFTAYLNDSLPRNIKKYTILNADEILLMTNEDLVFHLGKQLYGIKQRPFLNYRPFDISFSGMYNNYPLLLIYGEGVLAPKLLQQVKSYGKFKNLTGDIESGLLDNRELSDL